MKKTPAVPFGTAISLLWVLLSTPSTSAATDKSILIKLHTRTGGANWKETWDIANTPMCSWHGITCDAEDDGLVTEIVLDDNRLGGAIPKELWTLPSLRYFSAIENDLYDAGFDGFKKEILHQIQVIDLSNNIIENVEGIKNAPFSLRFLFLTGNKMSGPFPEQILALTNIRKLYFNDNDMTGPIPTEIGNLSLLIELYVYGNQLTGTIPTEIGLLKKAEIITLAENRLYGTIPTEVNELINIRTFSAHSNLDTSGKLSGSLPSFSKSPNINELRLDGNELTGTIPANLFAIAPETDQPITIVLDNNDLRGEIPSALVRFSDLYLGIVGNKISAIPRQFCDLDKWMNGLVAQFGCDAIACPIDSYNFKSGRQTIDSEPCALCGARTYTDDSVGLYMCLADVRGNPDGPDGPDGTDGTDDTLYDDEIDYSIDVHISQELTALTSFYMNSDPLEWENDEGWVTLYSDGDDDMYYNVFIEEESDYCTTFFGLTCENGRVTEIILPYNGLVGELHPSLFQLKKLKVLDLSYNKVWFADISDHTKGYGLNSHGFQGLKDTEFLEDLRMSGTATTKWTGLSGAKNLKHLYLNNLLFEERFPDDIYALTKLEYLEAKSADIHGSFGPELASLTNLKSLNLYYNELTGKIPKELGKLTNLEILELSENEFTGSIPPELQALSNLETFSIHHRLRSGTKGLSGSIPAFSDSPKLSQFALESNNLDGTVPPNFLDGNDNNGRLYIGLSDNKLSGSIPTSLLGYTDVFLNMAGNKMTSVSNSFCDAPSSEIPANIKTWMDGEVDGIDGGCDAIMCPIGTYSRLGLSNTFSKITCESCTSNTLYYGAKKCDSEPTSIEPLVDEREILIEFFYATGGRYWHNSAHWDDNNFDMCVFYGITCTNGRVSEIELQNNGLIGENPSSLWDLEYLVNVDFTNNAIFVEFDDIESEIALQKLVLSGTPFYYEESFTAIIKYLPNLRELDLRNTSIVDFNDMYSLSELPSLDKLDLSDNSFEARISSRIGEFTKLERYSCVNCDLYGPIPSELGELTNLKRLHLGRNELDGSLIDFQKNKNMENLDLSDNLLTGDVPLNFLANLDPSVDTTIRLANNKLTGTFPKSLEQMEVLLITLEGNGITSLPNPCRPQWMKGLVQDFGCDAILCAEHSYSSHGRAFKDWTGRYDCEQCPSDKSDYLGSMQCTESIGPNIELNILALLYRELDGINWINQRNWMSPTIPLCSWYGVGCDEDTSNVVSIQLDNNNMRGIVSSRLFDLTSLRRLDITGNDVNLSLYSIPRHTNLEVLGISSTATTSLSGVDSFPELRILYAGDNSMVGTFPRDLYTLTKLVTLEISYNNYTGSLERNIEDLTDLEEFYASNNDFFGIIPPYLGSLTQLQKLDLSKNRLSGSLPFELNLLTNLKELSLQEQTSITGLHGTLPSLSDLSLLRLDLQNNKIQGEIPNNFLSNSKRKNDQVSINLDFNELVGAVPESLLDFNRLNLYIAGNRLQNLPDSFCAGNRIPSGWMGGDVGAPVFGCEAIACPPGTYSSSGRASQEGPCKKCTENQYIGGTVCPKSYADEKAILKAIYMKTKGELWKKNANWMNDQEKICDWEGVICDGNLGPDFGGVTGLNLRDFGLDGAVPGIVFALPYLQRLNLKDNNVKISFEKIGSAESLETLNLSNTGLESLEGLSNARNLKNLHLTGNKISGKLSEIGILDLPLLETVFISWNNISGPIPRNIGQMSKLMSFYAYDNMIEGTIPTDIGRLTELRELVLSENPISGQIPDELGLLPKLELFAAYRSEKSGPKLGGTLPAFEKAVNLNTLYLDFNNIGGAIPGNFLESCNGPIEVTLSNNLLESTIPKTLNHIDMLTIELEGNKISDMDGSFCNNNQWMDGLVQNYNCNAILCFPGFANENGRATVETPTCRPCPNPTEYFGSTSCDAVLNERLILEQLYQKCNGESWTEKRGWMQNTSVCEWFGIKCDERRNIKSIILANNNLTGRPPKELFQLRFLQEISFYSNEIDFRFDGIEQARDLTILNLGRTELVHIDGVEKASSLELIRLNQNNLSGPFPEELFQLKNIKTIDLGNNMLTGPLSGQFANLPYLVKLDLYRNKLSGAVPSFEGNWRLEYIDISENSLDRPIPANFLADVPFEVPMFVDLSSNKIPGFIPSELDRFANFNLIIHDNEILSLFGTLCDNDNYMWQDGEVEKFSCDAIMCPPGTSNPIGRQDSATNPCVPCQFGNAFYGSTKCISPSGKGKICWEISCAVSMIHTLYYLFF